MRSSPSRQALSAGRGAPFGSGGGAGSAQLGSRGEELAAKFLQAQGYRILEAKVRMRWGEIDLVAWAGKTLCFIEVKTRSSLRFGFPEEAVGFKKQWRLARLAQGYLKRRRLGSPPLRFDVVSLLLAPDGSAERIRLIQGAFEAPVALL